MTNTTPAPAAFLEARAAAGETWTTLAGVAFHVVHRTLDRRTDGKKTITILRAPDGKAFRMMRTELALGTFDGVTYAHDADIDGKRFHVYVAPVDSIATKSLMGSGAVGGALGAPVILEGVTGRYRVARARAYDRASAYPVPAPEAPEAAQGAGKAMPEGMTAMVERLVRTRGCTAEQAVEYILTRGIAQILAAVKFRAKKKRAK